jgi:hypothetical protein
MMSGLCHREEGAVAARASHLRAAFYAQMGNEEFIRSITYGPNTPREVRTRFRVMTEMMEGVFGAS